MKQGTAIDRLGHEYEEQARWKYLVHREVKNRTQKRISILTDGHLLGNRQIVK